jgi:hypothetical protein
MELPADIRTRDLKDKTITFSASSESTTDKKGSVTIAMTDLILYNYKVYLAPQQTSAVVGSTLLVDLMLQGDINYSQIAAEITYDNKLLQFAGHQDLRGWAAAVTTPATGIVAVRSVPFMNMVVGEPCLNDVKIVTLKFTVLGNFLGNSIDTKICFASAVVSPPGGVTGTGVYPTKCVTITLRDPNILPIKVSYEGKWQDGLDEVTVEAGGRLALHAVYFTGDVNSPTGKISTDAAAVATGDSIAFQWYSNTVKDYAGATAITTLIDNNGTPETSLAMGNDHMPNTSAPGTIYYFAVLTYKHGSDPEKTFKSDIVRVNVTAKVATANPVSTMLTKAEASGWVISTPSADVYSWCKTMADNSGGRIRLVNIGKTAGRSTVNKPSQPQDVPMLIIGKPAPASPAAVGADKAVALVEANIHSGEVEGKEAMLIFAREVALGLHDDLLDDLVILVVPNQNADGNDYLYKQRINSQYTPKMVGSRFTGKDLNPYYFDNGQTNDTSESYNWYNGNRDMTKLDTPECTAVVAVMNEWDPVIFIDCHATNGSLMRHAVSWNWGLHPNTDPAVMAYNMGDFGKKAVGRDSYLYKVQGKTTQPYGNFTGGSLVAGTTRWDSFEDYPRYTTNYAGLRNRLAVLLEVYSHDPYTVRVDTQYACIYGSLLAVAEDKVKIKQLLANADKHAIDREKNGIVPSEDFVALNSNMQYLYDIDVETYVASPTGSSPLSYALRDNVNDRCGTVYAGEAVYTIGYRGNYVPTEKMPMGAIYLLDKDCTEAVALLQKHGIEVTKLDSAGTVKAGDFQWFKGARRAQHAKSAYYEGHMRNNFVGTWENSTKDQVFPVGTYMVSTAQPLGNLAALLLEPASVDGAITWNYFDKQLNATDSTTVRSGYPFTTTDTGTPTYAMPIFKTGKFDVINFSKPITATGIEFACDLGVTQQNVWVHALSPATPGVPNAFMVADNGIPYEVHLAKTGFYPIVRPGANENSLINAGNTIHFGRYFYTITVPQGVSGVKITSNGTIVDGVGAGQKIDLLCDFLGTIQDAILTFTYAGKTHEIKFLLDGTDPFRVFGAIAYAKAEHITGNRSKLTITITEFLFDPVHVITKEIEIDNNAIATYSVGPCPICGKTYQVYVDVKGTDQVRECMIVQSSPVEDAEDTRD